MSSDALFAAEPFEERLLPFGLCGRAFAGSFRFFLPVPCPAELLFLGHPLAGALVSFAAARRKEFDLSSLPWFRRNQSRR
jgi:hypothetical protein